VLSPREVIEATDWKSLYHAYEHAEDTPNRLLGLLSEEPEVCGDALAFLDAAVLHQGTIYPVTPPVVVFVAGILDDKRIGVVCESALPWDERSRPLRAGLLEWLGAVAESAIWSQEADDDSGFDDMEDEGNDDNAGSIAATRACRALLPEVYQAIKPFLDDPDEDVRQAALGAVGRMIVAPELIEFRGEQVGRLLREAASQTPREKAITALTLGNWGNAPADLLADEDPAVRACAAIARALDADPRALQEVKTALRDPVTADAWFPEWIPQLEGRFRFALVQALLRRTTTFDEIAEPALSIAAMTNAYTVESDWGPLLQRAFPHGYTKGQPLSQAQRAFLAAIAENGACWNSVANPLLFLHSLGLPDDRKKLRWLVASASS